MSKHLGVSISGFTFISISSLVSLHCHKNSFCITHELTLSTESDLGGMGGLSVGWYFLGKGGLLAVEIVDPLG